MRYNPMTDNEQEALQRMIEGQDVYVEVVGWGFYPTPTLTVGDKRLQVRFPMEFTRPLDISIPVRSLTLRLKNRQGQLIFSDTKPTLHQNQPMLVTAGLRIDLIWDIAVDKVSPEFQRTLLPGYKGTTIMEIP